jgi:hypothetical protein
MVINTNPKLQHKVVLHDPRRGLDCGLEVVEESPECNAGLIVNTESTERSASDDPDGMNGARSIPLSSYRCIPVHLPLD